MQTIVFDSYDLARVLRNHFSHSERALIKDFLNEVYGKGNRTLMRNFTEFFLSVSRDVYVDGGSEKDGIRETVLVWSIKKEKGKRNRTYRADDSFNLSIDGMKGFKTLDVLIHHPRYNHASLKGLMRRLCEIVEGYVFEELEMEEGIHHFRKFQSIISNDHFEMELKKCSP